MFRRPCKPVQSKTTKPNNTDEVKEDEQSNVRNNNEKAKQA